MSVCRNCDAPTGADNPRPQHCGECPPWPCDQCDEPCSAARKCGCWIELAGLSLADQKGLLAIGGLSIQPERGAA